MGAPVQLNEAAVAKRDSPFPLCKCPENRGSWRARSVAADNNHPKCSILKRATPVAAAQPSGLV
jgi:hypothetical protein